MMPRNLDRRVEISFPIEDKRLQNELMRTLIKISLKDNTKTKILTPDMSYEIIKTETSAQISSSHVKKPRSV